ncbi:hypothetical protein WJX74_008142 [Apatococcus lobatus]|uniref:Uncharacterized protein n=1 Tax=Apatococcus lobatus TaxID=904363 RepID=A0AAW1QW81_9CHLO
MVTEQQNSAFLHQAASGHVDVKLHREVYVLLEARTTRLSHKRHLKALANHIFKGQSGQLQRALKTLEAIGPAAVCTSQEANMAMLTRHKKRQQAATTLAKCAGADADRLSEDQGINPDLAAEEELVSNDEERKKTRSGKGPPHGYPAADVLDERFISQTLSSPAEDPKMDAWTVQAIANTAGLEDEVEEEARPAGGLEAAVASQATKHQGKPRDEKPAESTPGPNEATLSMGTPITAAAYVRLGDPREHSGTADPEASPSSKHPELPRTAADVRETEVESGMVRPQHPDMSYGPQLRNLFNLDDLPSPSALDHPHAADQLEAPAEATDRDQQPLFTAEPFQVVVPCQGVPPAARRRASFSFCSADVLQALCNPAVEDLLHDPTLEAAFDRLAGLTPASPAMAPTRAEAFQAPQDLPSLSRFGHGSQADFQLPLGAPASTSVAATCRENEEFVAVLEAKRRAAEHTWRFHTGEAASAMHECNRLDADILALTQGAHGHHFVAADN